MSGLDKYFAIPPDQGGYQDHRFKAIIEDHLELLRVSADTQFITGDPARCLSYRGDFYGLLLELQVPVAVHYATLRLQGYFSTLDYDGLTTSFAIPSSRDISILYNAYRTVSPY